MKTIKEINVESRALYEGIKAKRKEVKNLCMLEERRAAAHNHDLETVKALRAQVAQNETRAAALNAEIERDEIILCILAENAKAAEAAEALPIIAEEFNKYNGKPYGDKTRAKIYEAIKNRGYVAFIKSGNPATGLQFERLNENGFTNCNSRKVYANYNNPLLIDNKINGAAFNELKNPFTYTEDPAAAAAAIIEKAAEVKKIFEEAARIASEYNAIKTPTMKHADSPNFYGIF